MKGQILVRIFGLLVMVVAAVSSSEGILNNNEVSLQMEERPEILPMKLTAGKKHKNRKKNKKKLKTNHTDSYESSPKEDESGKAIANGIKNVGKIINAGRDFFRTHKKFDVTKETVPYHTGLAAQYGFLTSETIKEMDAQLKAIIASTNILMRKLQANPDFIDAEIPFDVYLGVMYQNVLLQEKPNTEIVKSDFLAYNDFTFIKTDRTPEKKKVMEVMTWFSNLINDTDVLKDTKIDIEDLANIVAASGAAVVDFATLFYAKDYVERSIVDVGVIRYPDPLNPFFKLFRIKIFAYRKSARVLASQRDESGIKGDFESVQFEPRTDILNKMREKYLQKAAQEAESMFDW